MDLLSWIPGFKPKNRNASIERELNRLTTALLGERLVPIDAKDENYIAQGFNKNLFVYMCVSFIIKRASDIPIKLMRKLETGEEEEIFDHPVLDLLKKPNPYTDGKEYIEKSLGYYLLTGNNYNWNIRLKGQEFPKESHVLPSQYIDIVAGRTWGHGPTKYALNLYKNVYFPAEEVTHFKAVNFDFENGQYLYGSSPLRSALMTINSVNSGQVSFTKQAQNDGVKGLLMQEPSEHVSAMGPEQLKQFKRMVKEAINGNDKKGLVEVTNMLFKYIHLGMNSADMQLLENHRVGKQDICAIYNLSSILFNDNTSSTYSNYEQATKNAYIDAILPVLNNFLAKLTADWLVSEPQLKLVPDTSNVEALKPDRSKLIASLVNAWWIPTTEKQRMTGVDPDDSLPKYMIPANLFPSDLENPTDVDEDIEKHLKELGINKY